MDANQFVRELQRQQGDQLSVDERVNEASHSHESRGAREQDARSEKGLLGHVLLDEDEDGEGSETSDDGSPDDGVAPLLLVSAERKSNEEESNSRHHGEGSEEVDTLDLGEHVAGAGGDVDLPPDDGEVDHTDGDLDKESPDGNRDVSVKRLQLMACSSPRSPAPSDRVAEKSSERSSDGSSSGVDDVTESLIDTTLPEGNEVRSDDRGHGGQSSSSDSGEGASGDELRVGGRETAGERAEKEDDRGKERGGLATENVLRARGTQG